MPGFAAGLLLLLLAALNCRNKVALATKYVLEHRSYSDVTLGPRNFSDRSSEGEDDDWEEHHEWTYTELDDDDDDESGERKLANSGYHHYAGGLMGHYKGGAWSGSPKYNRGKASHYIGTAEGVTTSRNEGRRIAFDKGKSREALTANQQSDSKSSQQRKESAYATNNKSTKLFKSRAPNSTVNSTKAKFVRAGGGHFRGQALHVRNSPQTTVSSRNKGSGAGNVKRSYGAERNASKVTGLGSKKIQSIDKLRSVASKGKKKKSSSTTSDINFGSKRHATRNSENFKRSYTANRKSTVKGTFQRKGDSTVKTYRRDKNHGVRKSLSSMNFSGSHHNGRLQTPSGSRNSGRNKIGSFEVKHTVGKARTKRVFPASKTSKRSVNKRTSSSRANDAVRRKSSPWHTSENANTSERSFVTSKTTQNNVSKRNSTGNSNVLKSQKSTSGGRESARTMVNKPSHQTRGNSSSNIISSTSENLEKRPRMKTSNSGNALLGRSNTNATIQSSNDTNAEKRLKTVAEKTVSTRPPAINSLLGMEQLKSKTSTQQAIRDTSVAFSKSVIHTQRHAFDTSNGSKSTDVVLGHSSTSRLPNEGTSAGNADLRTKGHRHYLAYNESMWSSVGYPLVYDGFVYPRYRYLVGSRRRRKKGRAVLRVHRIRRRRRKRKGRHKNAALPRAAVNVRDSSHGKVADDMHIRSVKTMPDRVTSLVQESSRNTQRNAHSDAVKLPALASHVNRSKLEVPELRKTTTTTVLPHKPQTTRKPESFVTESTTTSTKRPKVLGNYNPPNEKVIVQRRKNLHIQEMPSKRVFSPTRKEVRHEIPRSPNALPTLHKKNITQRVREKDPLVRRHRKMHHVYRRPRCRSIPAAHEGKAGKFVGGGLMWFPAASCVTSGLDWNSVHSTACLHQQIAFVHRYKVLAPPFHPVNENDTPGFCGSYVPWRHVTPHHVTDLLYDGSIVSGLSLHKFGFINPGGYTFELLPHTGRLILVGVPFHRRALSLCHLEPATLGLLFTGTGPRDGSMGMHRLVQICDRLEDYARTNPDNLYWGFPTVSVRTMPVAVRVPEASTDAITPVLPIAYESAEAFTQRVFTEPVALYPDAAVDYHETHTDFLEPVVFLANHVDRDVEYVDEDVVAPVYAEDMAVPVMEGHEAPVLEAAAETTAETAANDDMPTVIEMKDSVEYVPPVSENVHTDFIAAPDVAVDANAPAEVVYDGADEKTNNIAYDAVLGVDDADPGYYQEVAEPVVHVTVQTLSFPAPAI